MSEEKSIHLNMCKIIPAVCKVLTWAVSELKAQMGAAEAVDGDGQFDDLAPARTVVVVEDERAVLADVVFSWAQTNALLIKDRRKWKLFAFMWLYSVHQSLRHQHLRWAYVKYIRKSQTHLLLQTDFNFVWTKWFTTWATDH